MMIDSWLQWVVILANVVGGAYLLTTSLRGAGRLVSLLAGGVFGLLAWMFPQLGVLTLGLLVFGGIGASLWQKQQKLNAAHSHLVFEGGGIRRGLTPVETGLLLEISSIGLLAVSVANLLQKGILERGENGQFELRVKNDYQADKEMINPAKRTAERKKSARLQGKVLAKEEDMLLEMFWQGIPLNSPKFPIALWMDKVSQECDLKLGGYDRVQSVQYYKNYLTHRLNGVEKGFFQEDEFVPWMVLEMFAHTQADGTFTELINKTRPSWLHEGESLSDWAKTFVEVLG